MAGGSYRGGSTIVYTGNSKIDVTPRSGVQKKKKSKKNSAPGLHVLSKKDRKDVMKKVWKSRKRSQERAYKKEADEAEKKATAFSNFVNDVKKLQGE